MQHEKFYEPWNFNSATLQIRLKALSTYYMQNRLKILFTYDHIEGAL